MSTVPVTVPDWTPVLTAVAGHLHHRTIDETGVPVGTFTPTTRPPAARVVELVEDLVDRMGNAIGVSVPPERLEQAQAVAAVGAAADVELAQPDTDYEKYDRLVAAYRSGLEALLDTLRSDGLLPDETVDGLPVAIAPVGRYPRPLVWRDKAW